MPGIWLSGNVWLSGGAAVDVFHEGVEILKAATNIDFIGTGVTDVQIDGNGVDVYIGSSPPSWNIITFTHNAGTVEKGNIINNITLSWLFNDGDSDPDNQDINHGIGTLPVGDRTYNYTTPITDNITFTLTAAQTPQNRSKNTTVVFLDSRRWVSNLNPDWGTIDFSSGDLSTSYELASTRQKTVSYDCSGGKYFYYMYPTYMGHATFKVQGLPNSSIIERVCNFTNQYGHTEQYYVYRSEYVQNGTNIELEVL